MEPLRVKKFDSVGAAAAAAVAAAVAATASPPPVSRCCELLSSIGFTSNLPVTVIDTSGVTIPDPVKVTARLCTCGAPGGPQKDVDSDILIEIRGSTSARDYAKKR